MANDSGVMNLGKLVQDFGKINDQTTKDLNELQNATNINVASYMKLQVEMNTLSQVGQLITSTVGAVNTMVKGAIRGFQTQ
jgi:hypothetical protein